MRVLVDTNLWISFLLSRGKDNSVTRAVRRAMAWPSQIVMPQKTMDEITTSITKSSYLAPRIHEAEVDELLNLLTQIAIVPPPLQGEQQRVVRDPGDDYLIAYGLIHECHFLVAGDVDLLVLQQVRNLRIITAVQFVNISIY